ncbi:MAG: hypothetical protein JXO48_02900 [Deltaproteobacteria bacterium]|nr:hypothetical protein [Deltaproteobacteria bacterium]
MRTFSNRLDVAGPYRSGGVRMDVMYNHKKEGKNVGEKEFYECKTTFTMA